MKLLFDFFPILLFFVGYKLYGIYVATGVAIAASILQVAAYWFKHRKFENMHLITMVLIIVLGGATLFLRNEMFIKWKPTAINWAFAVAFLGSHFIGKKLLIQRMMDGNISLPTEIWQKLNFSWIAFFILIGIANLFVVYNFDTDTWVNFKLFGVLGLTFIFVIIQAAYMTRYVEMEKPQE